MTLRDVARQLVRAADAPEPVRVYDIAEEVQRIRSTDALGAPLRVVTTREEARAAALASVSSHCLDCGSSFLGNVIPKHDCRNAAGKDNAPMKAARAAGARRALQALKRFPIPPCAICGREDMRRPGEQHTCQLTQTPLPHDLAAAQWQRQGSAAALAAELSEIQQGGLP